MGSKVGVPCRTRAGALLAPAEKAALAQLSVFEGGFSLDSAEAAATLNMLAYATLRLTGPCQQASQVAALPDLPAVQPGAGAGPHAARTRPGTGRRPGPAGED